MSEKGRQPTALSRGPAKGLWRVSVTRVLYVIAENPVEAKAIAMAAEPNLYEMSPGGVELATHDRIEADEWKGAFVYGTDVDETAEDACKRLNP